MGEEIKRPVWDTSEVPLGVQVKVHREKLNTEPGGEVRAGDRNGMKWLQSHE